VRLKNFSTDIFAGINNLDLEFDDGLNILLGPNEAGKSTVVNAIYASLFIQPQIKLTTTEGKQFKNQYFPYPHGDYSDAELSFQIDDDEYIFYKKWSRKNYAGYLQLPDGARIESTAKIKEMKQELFPYAKSTYKNIVFSSQKDIKSTLKRINAEKNPELISTINSFLRKAVMELDGVSIDKFRSRLDNEIKDLTEKWDLESQSITNKDRGLNNPYKRSKGKIYESYIEKGQLKNRIKKAEETEEKYEELSKNIAELKSEETEILTEVEALEEIEDDINRRSEIEIRKKGLEEKLQLLGKTAEKWPEAEKSLKELEKSRKRLENSLEELKDEKERALKHERKQEIAAELEKIDKLEKSAADISKEIAELENISAEKIDKMQGYKQALEQSKASLKAAKLKAKINFSASDEIKVTSGIGDEENTEVGQIIEAEGYIRIKTQEIDIEVESAEIDFSDVQKEYRESQKEFDKLKKELDVNDLAEARKKLRELENLQNSKKHKEEKISEILEDMTLAELKKELQELKKIDEARKAEVIELEMENLNQEFTEVKTEIGIEENKIDDFQEEYNNLDNLSSLIASKKEQKTELKKEAEDLAELPDGYDSTEEFKADLKEKKVKTKKLGTKLREKLQELKSLENELPDISTREMRRELQTAEAEFKRLNEKARNLKLIKDTFEAKLEEMDQNSFQPLVNSFSSYLNQLTAGRYQSAAVDEKFNIVLEKEKGKRLPANLELLSFGTYDGTALALRFALFDNLFKEHGGFIILDDCLVNLDPERREKAVELINQFKEKYQIIYTSCSPDRAAELDGKIIRV